MRTVVWVKKGKRETPESAGRERVLNQKRERRSIDRCLAAARFLLQSLAEK